MVANDKTFLWLNNIPLLIALHHLLIPLYGDGLPYVVGEEMDVRGTRSSMSFLTSFLL